MLDAGPVAIENGGAAGEKSAVNPVRLRAGHHEREVVWSRARSSRGIVQPMPAVCMRDLPGQEVALMTLSSIRSIARACGAGCVVAIVSLTPVVEPAPAQDGTSGSTCVHLDPVDDGSGLPAPLLISEVDPGDFIEVFNPGDEDLELEANNIWFCSPFQYVPAWFLGAEVIPARSYVVLDFPSIFEDVDAGGEIILYRDVLSPQQFADGTLIADFVCWGVNPHFSRKELAESVGRWAGGCAPALSNGALHRIPGTTGVNATDYDTVSPNAPQECTADDEAVPGDANGDGVVDVQDITEVIVNWGPCAGCGADLDGSGVVDVQDLVEVVTNWT
jgi:hypothetical protein